MAKISWNQEELDKRDNTGTTNAATKELNGGLN